MRAFFLCHVFALLVLMSVYENFLFNARLYLWYFLKCSRLNFILYCIK